MKDFYLDLSSDDALYENNASSFKCSIQPNIELNGDWEVTLIEIALPRIKNIRGSEVTTTTGGRSKTYKIPDGYYPTPAAFVAAFRIVPGVTLRYVAVTEKMFLQAQAGTEVIFDENLAMILGFEHKKYTGTAVGVNTVDMFRSIKPILLQAGIIEPQVFGKNRRPLLRAIYTESPHIEFSPRYLPVIGTQLSDIDFQLTDINNRHHEFLPGRVNLTLHFRKCNQDLPRIIKETPYSNNSHYHRRR